MLIYGNAQVKRFLAEFTGDIVPDQDGVRDLGDATHKWAEIHQDLLYIGATSLTEAELITIKAGGGGGIPPITGSPDPTGRLPQITAGGNLEDSGYATSDFDAAGAATAAVAAHVLAADPHPQYLTEAEADALYDALGASAAAVASHEGTYNHDHYDTAYGWGDHAGLYDPIGTGASEAAAAVAAHVLEADPHPQYLTQTEGDALYQPLNGNLTDIAAIAPSLGGLIVWDGGDYVELPPGAAGQILQASASPLGLDWRSYIDSLNYIQFNTAFSDGISEGRLQWNSDDGTLEVGMPGGNVTLQVGQEHLVRCRNMSGVPIPNGAAVYVSGGSGNKPLIKLAMADAHATSCTIGIATEAIAHNSNGYVTTSGLVRGLDTSAFSAGAEIFLSASNAGELVVTPPDAPNHRVKIGNCIYVDGSNGVILVAPMLNPEVRYLSDVHDEAYGWWQAPVWNAGNSRFEAERVAVVSSGRSPESFEVGDILVYDGAEFVSLPAGEESQMLRMTNSPVSLAWETTQHPNEPNGFLHPAGETEDTTLTWNDGAGTITLAPTGASFTVFSAGRQFTSAGMVINMTQTEGIHWVYIDGNGVAQVTDGEPDGSVIETYALVCNYYWDATNSASIFRGDERHGMQMSGATHRYLHETVGCRWEQGLGLVGYTLNTGTDDAIRVGWTAGEIHDEDIDFMIDAGAHPGTVAVFYRKGASTWRRKTPDTFPFLQPGITDYPAGTYPAYNDENGGDWQLAEIGNNNYFVMWLFASTGLSYSIFAIPTQTQHATLASAQDEQFQDLNLSGMPFAEVKIIYKIIYQAKSTFLGTYKTRMIEVDDYRGASISGIGNYTPITHASLDGLTTSGHPASIISVSTAGFAGILSVADDTVQKALDTIDDHLHDGRYYTESEVDALLAAKMDLVAASPITGSFLIADGTGQAEESAYSAASFDAAGDAAAAIVAHVLEVDPHTQYLTEAAAAAGYQPLHAYLADIAALTPALGGLIAFDGGDFVDLPLGTDGQVLTVGGSPLDLQWSTPSYLPAGSALGDLLSYDGADWAVVSLGTTGQRLQVTGSPLDIEWTDDEKAFIFTYKGTLATGDNLPWVMNKFSNSIQVKSVYAMVKSAPTTQLSIDVEKNTQAGIDSGAGDSPATWTSIFDTVPTIDANEWSTATAGTAAVLNATAKTLAPGDHIRMRVTNIGTDGADLTVFVLWKEV